MRSAAKVLPLLTGILGVCALAACADQPIPGTMLGTFVVTGTPTVNTCGAGLSAPETWTFRVQLAKDGEQLRVGWLDGKPATAGQLDARGESTITVSQVATVDTTGACDMRRVDTFRVRLGEGEAPESFSGALTYDFSAEPGSDCVAQLSSAGGTYAALPCQVRYDVEAVRSDRAQAR